MDELTTVCLSRPVVLDGRAYEDGTQFYINQTDIHVAFYICGMVGAHCLGTVDISRFRELEQAGLFK